MVKQRQRIAKKPEQIKAEADQWILQGGIDPEVDQTKRVSPKSDEY